MLGEVVLPAALTRWGMLGRPKIERVFGVLCFFQKWFVIGKERLKRIIKTPI